MRTTGRVMVGSVSPWLDVWRRMIPAGVVRRCCCTSVLYRHRTDLRQYRCYSKATPTRTAGPATARGTEAGAAAIAPTTNGAQPAHSDRHGLDHLTIRSKIESIQNPSTPVR